MRNSTPDTRGLSSALFTRRAAFFRRRRLDFPARMSYLGALRLWSRRGRGPEFHLEDERPMAHKKIERKKELDRRRKRRAERMKLRAREARSGLKA